MLYPLFLAQCLLVFCDVIIKCFNPKAWLTLSHLALFALIPSLIVTSIQQSNDIFDGLQIVNTLPPLEATQSYIELMSNDNSRNIAKAYGVILLVLYFYFFFTFRIIPYLSKLLVIFSHILSKLLPFFVLQIILLYFFSFVFSSMNEIPVYQSQGSSFDTLLAAYFGNVDMGEMSSDFFSKAMVLLFMLLNTLIMANLLIAVMLEDYALLS